MAGQIPDMDELMRIVTQSPRRDNSAYHQAMAEARRALEAAQAEFGGPVRLKIKTRTRHNGDHVVKFIFKPARKDA